MSYENNHYVPQLVLRRFGEKISTYNIKTGEYLQDQKIARIFSKHCFYPKELEKDIGYKLESHFADILNNKILKAPYNEELELTRRENRIIKRFLLLEQMRVFCDYTEYTIKLEHKIAMNRKEDGFPYPFVEKEIKGESSHDRWLRNIRVILECENLESIYKHELCTYEAFRWAQIYISGYLAIWDSSFAKTNFIITDMGMTSEVEQSFVDYGREVEKKNYLLECINTTTVEPLRSRYLDLYVDQLDFHENYYMFSISKNRMIVIINPFFRMYSKRETAYPIKPTIWPSFIKDRRLFEKNRAEIPEKRLGKTVCKDTDKFRYKIHSMKRDDILWVNMLMLDRIDTILGFNDLKSVEESIRYYIAWHEKKNVPSRKDYSGLLKIIEEASNN